MISISEARSSISVCLTVFNYDFYTILRLTPNDNIMQVDCEL